MLLYGAPGTGKTLLARACAAQTKSTFLKLAGPQLVQMFIGDGAKLVRDAFALAKEKQPAIIFIDELDAIGELKKHIQTGPKINQLLLRNRTKTIFPKSLPPALVFCD